LVGEDAELPRKRVSPVRSFEGDLAGDRPIVNRAGFRAPHETQFGRSQVFDLIRTDKVLKGAVKLD
jgi:hypothetical protein